MNTERYTSLDYIYFIYRKWKLLIVNTIVIGIICSGISLLLPNWYKASSTIAPQQDDLGAMLNISDFVSNLPIGQSLGVNAVSSQEGLMLTILGSRSLSEKIINEYDLQKRYRKKDVEKTIKSFMKNLNVGITDENAIVVQFLDKDPMVAASIVNRCTALADSFIINLSRKNARNNRIFLEERINNSLIDIKNAQQEFLDFQEKSGVIAIEEQTRATIITAAELQAQIITFQIELETKKNILGNQHQEIRQIENRIENCKNGLYKLEMGANQEQNKKSGDYSLIPLSKLPEYSKQYINLYRNVEVQNKIYLLLLQQYEQAKFQEVKQTSTIQVIDKAIPPINKSKPKRSIIVLSCIFLTNAFIASYIILKEKINFLKMYNFDRYKRYQRFWGKNSI